MVRIVYMFHRAQGLSRKMCQKYWYDVHAPLVKKHAEVLGIKGYVQWHTTGNFFTIWLMRRIRKTMAPFDGAAQYWIDRDKMESALKTEKGKKAMDELISDESRFIDFKRSAIMVTKEYHIVTDAEPNRKSPVRKMTWAGSRKPELTPEQFQNHYINNHGKLVGGYGALLGIKKYDQMHLINDPLNKILSSSRGTGEPFLVSAEFIWDFKEMMPIKNGKEKKEAQQAIAEDEKRFINFPESAIWMSDEYVIIPRK